MPQIKIPTPLRRFAGENKTVTVAGSTVKEALDALVGEHEALRGHLYDEEGNLRNFVNVYLNDTDVRELQQDETPVEEGDTLVIVPSIAGGTR